MKYSIKGLVCSMLAIYSVIHAHVVDLHVPTAHEIAEEERRERQREIDDAWDAFEDEDSTDEEREEAFETLVEEEEIV